MSVSTSGGGIWCIGAERLRRARRRYLSLHCNRVRHRCADRRDGRAGLQLKAVAPAGALFEAGRSADRQDAARCHTIPPEPTRGVRIALPVPISAAPPCPRRDWKPPCTPGGFRASAARPPVPRYGCARARCEDRPEGPEEDDRPRAVAPRGQRAIEPHVVTRRPSDRLARLAGKGAGALREGGG